MARFKPLNSSVKVANVHPLSLADFVHNVDAQVKVNIQGALDVRFGDAFDQISDWQVIPTLGDILARVERTVLRFRQQLTG